jgi:hypothetical protein
MTRPARGDRSDAKGDDVIIETRHPAPRNQVLFRRHRFPAANVSCLVRTELRLRSGLPRLFTLCSKSSYLFASTSAVVSNGAFVRAFFKSIENHLDNNPYKVMLASGDRTCAIARWTGKMIGPWRGLDGKVHAATGKTFEFEFCTVAHWKNGEIVEEKLFYDQVGLLRQIGVL